jgi:uncharacterized protein (TIGR03086 family)
MLDLGSATSVLTNLIEGIRDDQLDAPTPCHRTTVGDLIDHVDGLSLAFTAAATKTPLDGGSHAPSADATRLGQDWRCRIPERLADLAQAWRAQAAWSGMTRAGGLDLPGYVAGTVALNEVAVHGWDLAAATGQDFSCDRDLLEAAYAFVQSAVARDPNGTPGLFGPPVAVPDDAAPVDRLIGLTGRDPNWTPAPQHPRRSPTSTGLGRG